MTADDWKRKSVYEFIMRSRKILASTTESTNLKVLRNFTDKTLEGELPDEELS
jgi:hypothetical protein